MKETEKVKEMETEKVKEEIFELECGNGIDPWFHLTKIEDPCDLYNYISENCPDNLDLLPPGLIGMDFIDCGEGDGDGEA